MKLGTPTYEKNKKNYFSFGKDRNTFILRILPPMGNLADQGKWSIFHRVEFGYKGTDNKMRPFLSPRVVNYKKMVEVESAAHLRREKIKEQNEAAKKAGNVELQKQTGELLRRYNQSAKHYMNAIDLQGNIGLFTIGHRGFQALQAQIDILRANDVDPVGVENGRFFVFNRSGTGLETLYTVQEYKEKVEIEHGGEKMLVDKPFPHSLNETIINRLSSEAFELDSVYPSITVEEEAIIMTGPEGVDKVFKAKDEAKKAQSATNPASTAQETPAQAAPVNQETMITEPNSGLEPAEELQKTVTPEASVQTTVAPETTLDPVTETAIAAETTAQPVEQATGDVSSMSEEDFLAMIEGGNF